MNQREVEKRVNELLGQMTPEEKIAQMLQVSYANCTREEALEWARRGVGSFLHVLGDDAREVQQTALHTRLGIPVIFGIDAVHGHGLNRHATIFPSQLSMGCTFDRELVEQIGRATAKEVAADGLHWTFAPILCLGRDLRWGRVDETFGEDPYLTGELGAAIIRGYQGERLDADDSILACAKHYIGYGDAVGGRDSCDTEMTYRKLRDTFIPPFKKAVEAGCATFMTSYGSIDGTPFTVCPKALRDILRGELGFDGFVVTDWDNVNSLVKQQFVYETVEEASVAAAQAGNDMMMRTLEFYDAACAAYHDGRLSADVIDEAVRHILTIKVRMGLFEHPEKNCSADVIGCEEHRALALRAAREGVVLLKNDRHTLPISNAKKIAVIGPNADDIRAQYGDWTYFTHPHNDPKDIEPQRPYVTMVEGIKQAFEDVEIVYHQGCGVTAAETDDIEGAVEAARGCDTIVLVLGDNIYLAGEKQDRADLSLSGRQTELLQELRKLNIPLVLVLVATKPLTIPLEVRLSDAVLFAFNGGMYGGQAVADVLAGRINPVGRLPITVPYHIGQVPAFYNSLPGWHGGKYVDQPAEPLFAFGEGMDYSCYQYSDLTVDAETLLATINVSNTGSIDGTETVQVYFRDVVSSVITPVKQLIAMQKVELKAGETKKVSFQLKKEDFSLVNVYEERVTEAGKFILMVGHSSKDTDLLKCEFTLKNKKGQSISIFMPLRTAPQATKPVVE